MGLLTNIKTAIFGKDPKVQARRYDAGSHSSRTAQWLTTSTDANSAITNPVTIRNRARDLARNNPWAAKGIGVIVNNTIGHGIIPQFKGPKRKAEQAQNLWRQWAETTACDADGLHNFYGLQALAMRSMIESGSCLIRMRVRQQRDDLPVSLQLQVIEIDHIVTHLSGKNGNNTVKNGIEYDQIGRRVAYYLYKNHPGSASTTMNGDWGQYSRVESRYIIHLFRRDRPGQEHGVSWLAPSIMTLRELGIYEDAYLKRQQIANLHAGFIHTEEDIDDEVEQYTSLENGLTPGSLYLMRPNRSIEFNSPPPAGDYGPFVMESLRTVAASLGITFEALTGNLSEVNYSSARMGWQEMARNIDNWRWNLFIPLVCDRVAGWFMSESDITALSVDWTAPARTMVDPAKEIPPMVDAIRAGVMTPSEAIRQRGHDPETTMQEWATDAARMDELGLVFSCDPRRDTAIPTNTNTTSTEENI